LVRVFVSRMKAGKKKGGGAERGPLYPGRERKERVALKREVKKRSYARSACLRRRNVEGKKRKDSSVFSTHAISKQEEKGKEGLPKKGGEKGRPKRPSSCHTEKERKGRTRPLTFYCIYDWGGKECTLKKKRYEQASTSLSSCFRSGRREREGNSKIRAIFLPPTKKRKKGDT